MKSHRKYSFLVTVILLGIIFNTGCINQDRQENKRETNKQTFVWNIISDPNTLDPSLNIATDGAHIINNLFEGLTRENNGRYEPAIASKIEVSQDGKKYTFTIREDAYWSDGIKLTAYDFEYAWNRVLDPDTNAEYSLIFDEAKIDCFKAISDEKFEVYLKVPNPYLLELTSFYIFFPLREDIIESNPYSWSVMPETCITNGPFLLDEFNASETITLKRNPYYWNKRNVLIEEIELVMQVDSSQALKDFEEGKIDILSDVPKEDIGKLIKTNDNLYIFTKEGTYYYSFNLDNPALEDVRVRKALSMAIDRSALVNDETGLIPAINLVPPTLVDNKGNNFSQYLNSMNKDFGLSEVSQVQEAQQLLVEAGYPNGEGLEDLTIIYNESKGHKQIAESIKAMWSYNLGVDVELVSVSWNELLNIRADKEYSIIRNGWVGDYSDPMTHIGIFTSDSQLNYNNWNNQEFDALIDKSLYAFGDERDAYLYEAATILASSYINMPIYYYSDEVMVSDRVIDWQLTSRNQWYFGKAKIVETTE